jgi:hypothetical protein
MLRAAAARALRGSTPDHRCATVCHAR